MNAGEREVNLAEWRQRAEFWTTRDPSTIGHLYDECAVSFAGEVMYLLDALEAAERKIAAVEALADEWETPGADAYGPLWAAKIRAAIAAEDTDGGAS